VDEVNLLTSTSKSRVYLTGTSEEYFEIFS
jgi:hypothetical protein